MSEVLATLTSAAESKTCDNCQYRYVVGQRPYPTFAYMCGFGEGKRLTSDTSRLMHMCCPNWAKEGGDD